MTLVDSYPKALPSRSYREAQGHTSLKLRKIRIY